MIISGGRPEGSAQTAAENAQRNAARNGRDSSGSAGTNLSFDELLIEYKGLPELQPYHPRDGAKLFYRYYRSESDRVVIMLHGSGYHSKYLLPLARFISTKGLASVYTPDLRGHGEAPARRGDIDYIGQYEDDIADLIALIREENPDSVLIIGGHSSGGGLVIRFAGSRYG